MLVKYLFLKEIFISTIRIVEDPDDRSSDSWSSTALSHLYLLFSISWNWQRDEAPIRSVQGCPLVIELGNYAYTR